MTTDELTPTEADDDEVITKIPMEWGLYKRLERTLDRDDVDADHAGELLVHAAQDHLDDLEGEHVAVDATVSIRCHRCGYQWDYSGTQRAAPCPNCTRKTSITGPGEADEIVVAGDGTEILDEDEDTCRNGTPNCAGPAVFDLSCEFSVPICSDCREEPVE